ncbi:MAG: O-antigen ligase family protein [Acholeplasmatales bacterium]|nr:O-antigen ligase family protein [Acholeplasmatales bacterium]
MLSIFKQKWLSELNNNWIFEYLITLTFVIIGILGWFISYNFSICILVLTIGLLLVFNDFKYIIPAGLCLLFSYNAGYTANTFPVEIALYAGIFILLLIGYTIYNFKKINLKKPKSYIGIALLTVSCIIPIFWNKAITEESRIMYAIYFTWVLYIVIYFIFGMNLSKHSLRIVIFTLSAISVLISFECGIKVLEMHRANPDESIFNFIYSLGWGICNEAGIMLCFCMPFIFYEIIKTKNPIISLVCVLKMIISLVGIVLTASRAAVFFGFIEFFVLTILMIIFSKNKLTNIVFLLLFLGLGILYVQLYFGIPRLFDDVKNILYNNIFDGNGRERLYNNAINLFNTNFLTRILGSGIISEFEYRWSFGEYGSVFVVYHSTFFETLVMGGIVGICFLLIHFFEKYKQLWKKELPFSLTMLVGYLLVDIYGMLDNTYGMYYYMIPLVILMASLDNDIDTNIFENEDSNELIFAESKGE